MARRDFDDRDDDEGDLSAVRVSDARQRVIDILDSAAASRAEAAAGVLDVARGFLQGLSDNEPLSRSRSWADVARARPATLAQAAQQALNEALIVPRRTVGRFYGEYASTKRSGAKTGGGRERVVTRRGTGLSQPERRVLAAVDSFFSQVPGEGARIDRVIDHVVLETDYDRAIVRSIIKRNYVSNGAVMSKEIASDSISSRDSTTDYMVDTLRDQGFDDIRFDVELEGLPGLDGEVALIAYQADRPVVVGYPVAAGAVDDSGLREAAIFQASAIAPGVTAQYVWVSDGEASYIYDVAEEQVVANLPVAAASGAATGAAAVRARGGRRPTMPPPLQASTPET
jgi:hypothetical protein